MSFLFFNVNGVLETCVKEKNDMNLIRGDVAHYESQGLIKEVSRDEYKSVVSREKDATLQEGNVVLSDAESFEISYTQEDMQKHVDNQLETLDVFLKKHAVKLANAEHSSLNTRLNEYKTALTNFDASSLNYPVTVRFHRHWFDNESVEPFSNRYLQ